MADIPEVLFVRTHNTGRSQMAAALLDHQAAGRVRVISAGSQPADQLNPAVFQAIAEIGLDICGDACPIYPGKRYEDWELPDPAGLDLAAGGQRRRGWLPLAATAIVYLRTRLGWGEPRTWQPSASYCLSAHAQGHASTAVIHRLS